MPIFEKGKKSIERRQLREAFRKGTYKIPGTSSKIYTRRDREKMADALFPSKRFGSHVTEIEVRKKEREMRSERHKAKTSNEKREISRKLEYLKKFTGVKPYK